MAVKKYRNYQNYGGAVSQATNRCGCVDINGKPKKNYKGIVEAKNAQDFVRNNNGIEVSVYNCPCGKGYHLTSHSEE